MVTETPTSAEAPQPRRIGRIPVRAILPNMVTVLALCAGLTAIRMTIEARYELAIYAVLAAAVLDGLDGRIARFLKSTSKFGAELDSLSDFVSFGVAPAILLYGWILHEVRSFGWLAALVLAIAGALRLARFNVQADVEKPAWQGNFFTGVPAPAGAILALLPLYVDFSGLDVPDVAAPLVLIYTVVVALLMVSRIPTFSGKKLGRIRRDLVLPLFVALVLAVGLLLSFPFETLSMAVIAYLAAIPLGWRAYNRMAAAHGLEAREIGFEAIGEIGEAEDEDDDDAPGRGPVQNR
jgi:CDP-diacylglycerol---serine O-phosphatidyltransferase